MSDFVHLHLHSEYSLLDGACRVRDIPKAAKEAVESRIRFDYRQQKELSLLHSLKGFCISELSHYGIREICDRCPAGVQSRFLCNAVAAFCTA